MNRTDLGGKTAVVNRKPPHYTTDLFWLVAYGGLVFEEPVHWSTVDISGCFIDQHTHIP